MSSSEISPPQHREERRKLKWFLGFVVVVLLITVGTDLIFSWYGSPNIPKERDPFITTEAKNSPTPFFTPVPSPSTTTTSPPSLPILSPTIPINPSPTTGMKACPMDAKQCPDGKTYVGRSGPNCEFVACPTKK